MTPGVVAYGIWVREKKCRGLETHAICCACTGGFLKECHGGIVGIFSARVDYSVIEKGGDGSKRLILSSYSDVHWRPKWMKYDLWVNLWGEDMA